MPDWALLCKRNSSREGASVTQWKFLWLGRSRVYCCKTQAVGTLRLWDSHCLEALPPPWEPHRPRFVHLTSTFLF